MNMFNIYIFTIVFSLLQFIIEVTKENVLKMKKYYTHEKLEKDIREIGKYSEKTANVLEFICNRKILYRCFMILLCFIPIVNIVFAFGEICEILNIED